LNVSAFADLVKNKADHPDSLRAHNDGEYLPNMPTNRYGANLQWQREGWKAQLSSTYYDTQKYLGRNVSEEVRWTRSTWSTCRSAASCRCATATSPAWRCSSTAATCSIEEARPHNSPLKYIAPLPGRGFQVGVTVKL
jgi:iron complex outermembrane receptor protein